MKAVPSTYHQCIKFPSNEGIKTIYGDQQTARTCYLASHKLRPRQQLQNFGIMSRTIKVHNPADTTEGEIIHQDYPEQKEKIGIDVSERGVLVLKDHETSFAWEAKDVSGINLGVISHELRIDPSFKPVKQKRRALGPERTEAVDKPLVTGSTREVKYPDWLANPVVVKKKKGKWRVCVDFTDLSKECPKDNFPLPHIDRLIESTAGHERLSFIDAYSGYNQVVMNTEDQEGTSFITDRGTHGCKVMLFDLKNAGATYQQLVNRKIDELLGKKMEVYIDNMLATDHADNSRQCVAILNKFGMKLNPSKCILGVPYIPPMGIEELTLGLTANSEHFELIRITREGNTSADTLEATPSTSDTDIKRIIPVKNIVSPSSSIDDQLAVVTRSKFRANLDSQAEPLPNKRAQKGSERQKSTDKLREERESCEMNKEEVITGVSEADSSDPAPETKQQTQEVHFYTPPEVRENDRRIPIKRNIKFGEPSENKWEARN